MIHYEIPRVMVAAIQGRSGKTTFTIGLLKALRQRGLAVQPFKKGPDYIDPSWATEASGVASRNLDAVMMDEAHIRHALCHSAKQADLSVVEGAMGIFDGLDVEGSNSSAELAHLLEIPVILVVSGQRITRSVAALINGVVHFDPRIQIQGVVLNQVARPRHLNIMTQSIERYCDVPILGALPKVKDIEIPDRHLGLIPATEQKALLARVERLGDLVAAHVDLDRIIQIAQSAPPLADPLGEKPVVVRTPKPVIGVFRDRAFSFYYPENLEALEAQGAELAYIDATKDVLPQNLDGLYIGGGFPEVLAEDLSANQKLLKEVRRASEAGMPIYAECGGLMYLSEAIVALDGTRYDMAGVFPCEVTMEKRPQGHGYAIQEATEVNPFFPEGMVLQGHEFHHSVVRFSPDLEESAHPAFAFATRRGKGIIEMEGHTWDGMVKNCTLAGYHHFHANTTDVWAKRFVELAGKFSNHK